MLCNGVKKSFYPKTPFGTFWFSTDEDYLKQLQYSVIYKPSTISSTTPLTPLLD